MIDQIERHIKKRSSFSVLYVRRYFNKKEYSYTHFVIFIYRIFRVSIRLLIYKKEDPVWLIFYEFYYCTKYSHYAFENMLIVKNGHDTVILSLSQKAKNQLKTGREIWVFVFKSFDCLTHWINKLHKILY